MTGLQGPYKKSARRRTARLTETWSGAAQASATTDTLYGYDALGRLKGVSSAKINGLTPATPATQWSRFDATGQIVTGNALPTTDYDYDLAGNLDHVKLPNGDVEDYDYGHLNRLEKLTTTNVGNFELFEQTYTLKSNGQRDYVIEKRFDGVSTNPFSTTEVDWAYDDLGRLVKESRDEGTTVPDGVVNHHDYTDDFTYDLAGNRRTLTHAFYTGSATQTDVTAYTYNGRDELTSEGIDVNADGLPDPATATTYIYDANGSTLTKTSNGATVRYVWNLRNRLAGMDANNDGDTIDTGDASFLYDASGMRVSQTEAGQVTQFLNDGQNPTGYSQTLEEKNASGSVTLSYVLGADVIAQAKSASSNVLTYLVHDGHGSTRALGNANGTITDWYDYDAFGNAVGFEMSAAATRLLYDGEGYDSGLKQQFLRDRYYDQTIGRFSSFDNFQGSLDDPSHLHKYVFGGNDPENQDDPTGQDFGAIGGIGNTLGGVGVQARPSYETTMLGQSLVSILGDYPASDSPFDLADEYVTSLNVQYGALVQYAKQGVRKAWAAARFELQFFEFLKDYVAIDPELLVLGFVGARACFVAGTQVVTDLGPNGTLSTKNIEDIRAGDYVVTRDQNDERDRAERRRVVRTACS